VNLYGLCGCPAVQQCAAVRQFAVVRAALLYGSAHSGVRAVPAAVCDSTLGIVWRCARQCALRQCGSVRCDSAAVCGSERLGGSVR
jgi:hypothetical protein